jgi:hypothetical protein
MSQEPLTRRQRLRRVALLCIHAISNFACYRGGREANVLTRSEQFWKRANGNFLDIGLLEWCKLFADPRGDHYWRGIVSDPDRFETMLLSQLGLSQQAFLDYITQVKSYRDKFVAHLDSELIAHFPKLDIAINSAQLLLRYIAANEDGGNFFEDLQMDGDRLYKGDLADAKTHYAGRVA